jgi:hypothetical protein
MNGDGITVELNEGYADIHVINDLMKITPDQTICFDDGTVPVSDDISLPSDLLRGSDFQSITIKKGLYQMDANKKYVVVNVESVMKP